MRQFLRRNKADISAYTCYLLFALLLFCVCALQGCGLFSSAPVIKPMMDADSWQIPVIAAKIEPAPIVATPSGGQVSHVVGDAPDMVITVPASDKPTVIEVRKKKRTIIDKTLTNKPVYEVKSDNKGVTAAQPKQTVWWKWIVAGVGCLLLIVLVVIVVAQKVANFSPWGFILKLFRRG